MLRAFFFGSSARALFSVWPVSAAILPTTHSAKLLALSACAAVAVIAMIAAVIRFFICLLTFQLGARPVSAIFQSCLKGSNKKAPARYVAGDLNWGMAPHLGCLCLCFWLAACALGLVRDGLFKPAIKFCNYCFNSVGCIFSGEISVQLQSEPVTVSSALFR